VRFVVAPALSFWTNESSAEMGVETGLWSRYHYSEDLVFEAGWSHLFTGDGLLEGNYCDYHGLEFNGGTDQDDADYLYVEAKVTF